MKFGGHFATGLSGAIAAALTAAPPAAGTTTGDLPVTMMVEDTCYLQAHPLRFGAMPANNGRADAQSTLALTCTPAASYIVTLDDGRHGADGTRRMADTTGTAFLAYELYSDAARTRRWGATAKGMAAIAPASGAIELAVFASVAAGGIPPGAYADTITVTVAF